MDTIVESVLGKYIKRSYKGFEKYGKTLDRDDLNELDWLIHAQEEAMDHALYLEKLIQLKSSGGVTAKSERTQQAVGKTVETPPPSLLATVFNIKAMDLPDGRKTEVIDYENPRQVRVVSKEENRVKKASQNRRKVTSERLKINTVEVLNVLGEKMTVKELSFRTKLKNSTILAVMKALKRDGLAKFESGGNKKPGYWSKV